MSALWGAVTVGCLGLILYEVEELERGSGVEGDVPARRWASLAAVLTVAASPTLWFFATVAEVYTMTLAALAAAAWVALVWRRRSVEGAARTTVLAGLVGLLLGLALGLHHVTVILGLPAFLAIALTAPIPVRRRLRAVGWTTAGIGLGLTSYLYLPIAATARPVLAWGEPVGLERFWWHVSARQYQVNLFSGDLDQTLADVGGFFTWLAAQLTPLGLAVAALGIVAGWKRWRWLAGALLAWAACAVAYAVNYEIAEDSEAYFLAPLIALAPFLAAGWWRLLGPRGNRRALLLLAFALPALLVVRHRHENDRRNDRTAVVYAADALRGVGEGGVLLTLDWQLYAPYLYLRHVEGWRPDAVVIDVNLVRRSWYVDRYLRQTYPDLLEACGGAAELYLRRLADWEHGRPHQPSEITRAFRDLLGCFLARGTDRGGDRHLTVPMEPEVGGGGYWVPTGLTLKVLPSDPGVLVAAPRLDLPTLLAEDPPLEPVARVKVIPYYATMLANRGRYLTLQGRLDQARDVLSVAATVDSSVAAVHHFRGDLEASLGRWRAAEAAYRRALEIAPGDPTVQRKLATVARR